MKRYIGTITRLFLLCIIILAACRDKKATGDNQVANSRSELANAEELGEDASLVDGTTAIAYSVSSAESIENENLDIDYCFDWELHEKPSYVLFVDSTSTPQYIFKEMDSRDGRICTTLNLDSLNYIILPFGGRATTKDYFMRHKELKKEEILDIHILVSPSDKNKIKEDTIDRINLALRTMYSGFQFGVEIHATQDFESLSSDSIIGKNGDGLRKLLYNRHQLIEREYEYVMILKDSLIHGASSAFGYESKYPFDGPKVKFILGSSNLLNKQWLTIHELCHLYDADHLNSSRLVVGTNNVSALNVMSADIEFCRYTHLPQNFFRLHGLISNSIESNLLFIAQDTTHTCDEESLLVGNSHYEISDNEIICNGNPIICANYLASNSFTSPQPGVFMPAEIQTLIENSLNSLYKRQCHRQRRLAKDEYVNMRLLEIDSEFKKSVFDDLNNTFGKELFDTNLINSKEQYSKVLINALNKSKPIRVSSILNHSSPLERLEIDGQKFKVDNDNLDWKYVIGKNFNSQLEIKVNNKDAIQINLNEILKQ